MKYKGKTILPSGKGYVVFVDSEAEAKQLVDRNLREAEGDKSFRYRGMTCSVNKDGFDVYSGDNWVGKGKDAADAKRIADKKADELIRSITKDMENSPLGEDANARQPQRRRRLDELNDRSMTDLDGGDL